MFLSKYIYLYIYILYIERKILTKLAMDSNAFPLLDPEVIEKFEKQSDGSITTNSRRELLLLSFQMIESQLKACAQASVMDEYDSSLIALLHSTLVQFGGYSSSTGAAGIFIVF